MVSSFQHTGRSRSVGRTPLRDWFYVMFQFVTTRNGGAAKPDCWTVRIVPCYRRTMNYAVVFIGGGIGAALRYAVNRASLANLGPAFPYGTLFVNVAGSLAMGVLTALFLAKAPSEAWRLFLTTGVLGGFTTFSAFSLDTAVMWQRGDYSGVGLYVAGSVLLSTAALFLGMAAARPLI